LKFVNCSKVEQKLKINLSQFKHLASKATLSILTGASEAKNSFENPTKIIPVTSEFKITKSSTYNANPMTLSIIRVRNKK